MNGENSRDTEFTGALKWRKIKNRDIPSVKTLLLAMEENYVSACARFLARNPLKDPAWALCTKDNKIAGLLVSSRSTLIPVLCERKDIPAPRFLGGVFRKKRIHSVQGLKEEVLIFADALEQTGKRSADIYDYDLMSLDSRPSQRRYSSGPDELILRVPQMTDIDEIAALQAAYEQEEVIPSGSVFSPSASRVNAVNIISGGQILAAQINGKLVGKININAVSFTRYQVGGVYVRPDFRGHGIASRMAAEFTGSLISRGRGVTLFVKKSNIAARRLYSNLGFTVKGDYRITYY
ncbi:MAG: GNAT family N-acetyltransferase [Treponema sp.]|nr:GNAT family N-acetyltransferase [Treponema sp.]